MEQTPASSLIAGPVSKAQGCVQLAGTLWWLWPRKPRRGEQWL